MCCFSDKRAIKLKSNDQSNNNEMCRSGKTCLHVNFCFSELARSQIKFNLMFKRKQKSSSFHQNVACSRYGMTRLLDLRL